MPRIVQLALCLGLAFPVSGQLPRPFYAWWNSPVVRDLKLTPDQRRQIRLTVRDYRGQLADLRSQIERAEADLEYQFNQERVDTQKAQEAIERLAGARSELTKTLSQMSLKLRTVLTQEQWQELQRRRPRPPTSAAPPPVEGEQRK